jgi:hypothetical protein
MLVLIVSILALIGLLQKLAQSKFFIAYTKMHNMPQMLIDKKSFLRFFCNSSNPNNFPVVLIIVHKPILIP